MLKKSLAFLICFYCISTIALAKDRHIYFVENYQYKDLYQYKTIKNILDNSIKGLAVQRGGGCDFAFFYSISRKHPSNISIQETPIYIMDDNINNISFKGFVEKDGTLYVPSKFLVSGQTFTGEGQNTVNIFIEHVQNIKDLDEKLENIEIKKDTEIIISSWCRKNNRKYENYIMPIIYYNNNYKGIFYSETTRNEGIVDYENISSIMSGSMSKLRIINGDINEVYNERIQGLKNKKTFLSDYGYCMGALTIINSILLLLKYKKSTEISSLFVITSPLAVLIEPVLNINGLNNKIVAILIFTIILSIIVAKVYIKKVPLIFLSLIYLDAVFFRFLLKNSLLSYEPALGARFYGIGNELLGVIIAYILIFISEYRSINNWMIWLINAMLLLYDGGGNNFGGFLTCGIIGFFISPLYVKLFEIFAAVAMIYISNSHIGVFFRNLISLKLDYIIDILGSKLNTFKHLLQANIWTELIVISILIYLYNLLKGIFKLDGYTIAFMISCILVVIFNDSGIVSCALIMMVYLNYIFYTLSIME